MTDRSAAHTVMAAGLTGARLGEVLAAVGLDPALAQTLAAARLRLWESVGRIVLALMPLPRPGTDPRRRLAPAPEAGGLDIGRQPLAARRHRPQPAELAAVIGNFRKLAKEGRMKLHPGILRLLDEVTLKMWGSTILADHAAIAPSADAAAAHSAVQGGA